MNVWITGSNRGIGLSLVRNYIAKGDKVFALCRKKSPELSETAATIIEGIDTKDISSFSRLKEHLDKNNIDVFIHNAGILQTETIKCGTSEATESVREQFTVNALGPFALTEYIYSYLKSGDKLVFVTSRMGSIADNTSGGKYGYRMSKVALNMMCRSLAIDLQPLGVAVCLVHPGWVQTEMTKQSGNLTTDDAAKQIIARITESTVENSATFWHSNGDVLPW